MKTIFVSDQTYRYLRQSDRNCRRYLRLEKAARDRGDIARADDYKRARENDAFLALMKLGACMRSYAGELLKEAAA